MAKQFLVITQPDGDHPFFFQRSKAELLKEIENDPCETYLDHIPKYEDGYFHEQGTFILEIARVVVPKPVTTVTTYSID